MLKLIKRLDAFLSPAAFEQRTRDRERAALVEELGGIEKMRAYCDAREPIIYARLERLHNEQGYAIAPQATIARGY